MLSPTLRQPINPRLPELAGDHHGLDGLCSFFERLGAGSDSRFHNEPHSLTSYGDELVVAYATNTISSTDTVRPHQPETG